MKSERKTKDDEAVFSVAAGGDLPLGTRVEIGREEHALYFVTPGRKRRSVTHDVVKTADVLAVGILGIDEEGRHLCGVKYHLELTDGTRAVLTVPSGPACERVEHVLF